MTSDKQIDANRQNALKSTGPKTPEGKAAVRLNAVKHGLLSRDTLVPGEDEAALRELGERLRDELQPVGEPGVLLVNQIIASYWRLRRLGRARPGGLALVSKKTRRHRLTARRARTSELAGVLPHFRTHLRGREGRAALRTGGRCGGTNADS